MEKFGTWLNGFIIGTTAILAAESLGILCWFVTHYDISEKDKKLEYRHYGPDTEDVD